MTSTDWANEAGWAANQVASAEAERPATMSSSRAGPGLIVGRGEVDDERDESARADASGSPTVLIDADHPYPGQPVSAGRGHQVGGRAHGDRAHGVPGDAQFGGDGRDGGAVNQ
jgi:hypothetical protein